MKTLSFVLTTAAASLVPVCSPAAGLVVKAENPLSIARASQTLELTRAQLEPLGAKDLATVHVKDDRGHELVCQAVDTDYDAYHQPDIVIFQADFAPSETRTFSVVAGKKQEYSKDQFKAFGRFVRERFDDFAWENDRIAHRTYGKALETWEGEPLSSSTIDIWSKRTPRMVINDWYLSDHYHEDSGEGADFYSAGPSRGCGGSGLWAEDRLWTSRNFVDSRVLANGPIRVVFELVYEPFDVNGISVAEVKRVTLDAGSQLDHYQSTYKQYTRPGQARKLTAGIGVKKASGEKLEASQDAGWLLKWEPVAKNAGQQGLAVIVDPKSFGGQAEDKLNHLVLAPVAEDGTLDYWAGFCWDKAGHITTAEAWKQYVAQFAVSVASPILIEVRAQ